MPRLAMNAHLDFLLSALYDRDPLLPHHLADLRASALTEATIAEQKFRTVPPHMIDTLLGFPARRVVSAYLLPFADPRGGWFDHVRLKVFPAYEDWLGRTVKYLGPPWEAPRVFFALKTLDAALHSDAPLWLVEGAKKALAVAQLELPAIGFEGIEAWHRRASIELLDDFQLVKLSARVVELVPDGDVRSNDHVRRGVERLAAALARAGAKPRLVALPTEIPA
jgi:hypothetical protein